MNKNLDGNEHYLTDDQGKRIGVFLSLKKYEKIMSDLEDYQDVLLADKAYNDFTQGRSF